MNHRGTAARPSQLVQHDAEREEVGAMIEGPAFDLFGRHVRHRADDGSDLGPEVSGVLAKTDCVRVNRARQSEIENFYPALVSHDDVRGFQSR